MNVPVIRAGFQQKASDEMAEKPQQCWDGLEPDFRCPWCGHAWMEPESHEDGARDGDGFDCEYTCQWGPDNQGKTGGCGAKFTVLATRWLQTDYEVRT
jgi:hypothetical protein